MNNQDIINLIENFAPLETQESWDTSGAQIDFGTREIKKVLLALTVTEDIVNQAIDANCDMIIAHHPLFFIPFELNKNIPIYSAHTNLDKTKGGTTDTLINLIGFDFKHAQIHSEFLRLITLDTQIELNYLVNLIKEKLNLETVRVVNNFNLQNINSIVFCAGSGADFLNEAQKLKADVLITGDLKYHIAIDSEIVLIDVGHFESEHPVLNTIKKLITPLNIEVIIADEKSPFINY